MSLFNGQNQTMFYYKSFLVVKGVSLCSCDRGNLRNLFESNLMIFSDESQTNGTASERDFAAR